jgi:hypothetical protein
MHLFRIISCAAIALALFSIAAAKADTVSLNFAGLQDTELVNNYYNGGSGSAGSGPGPNYGIVFNNAEVCVTVTGTCNNVANQPGPPTVMQFISGTAATMNVAAGFQNGFSFYYSACCVAGSINVWSGLGGTGTLLATLALPTTPQDPNFPNQAYSTWDPIGVSFAGTAESVDFAGSALFIAFDDVTLGAASPVNPTPLPGTIFLLAGGIGTLGLFARRRKTRTTRSVAA